MCIPAILYILNYIYLKDSLHVYNQCGTQVLDQVADERNLIIAVGYMLRSSPAVVAAKQLMREVCYLSTLESSWNVA